MKKFILLTTIFVFLFCGVAGAYSENAEDEICSMLKSYGFNEVYVSTENNILEVKLGFDIIPEDAFKLLLNVALESFEKYENAEDIIVEAYIDEQPEFALYLRGKDASDYFKGKLTDEDISELARFADLRSTFSELSDDLLEYNALVESVSPENSTLNVYIKYVGNRNNFNEDLLGMLFCTVQDYPYADKISIKLLDGNSTTSINVKSGDVLDLFNDKITPEQFERRVAIEKESQGIMSNIRNVFSGTFPVNKNTKGIIGVVLAFLSIILFAVSKAKKKRIAKILNTKRLTLDKIPEGKRIYGKFNGVTECDNPIPAPLSGKHVTVYKGRIQVYKETDSESGSSNWQTVWSKSIAADFKIKELKSGKFVDIKSGDLPDTDLPLIFKSKIDSRKAEEITGKKILGKSIVAMEKGLEVGRKVLFIGGIKRDNERFTFVKRPGFPNMISVHSETRLTGHYRKLSGWLTFLGMVSLIGAIYFFLAYIGVV